MKEKLWLFVSKFILISVPLFALWFWKGEGWYLEFLRQSLTLLLIKIGGFTVLCFPVPKPLLINVIPFISLMVVTKGIKLKVRFSQIGEGLLILIVWHMILTEAVYLLLDCQATSDAYEKLSVPLYLFSGTLPFILWILFSRSQVAGLFLSRKKTTR